MRRYMGTDEDRERIKKLLNKEAVGWRKERLVALKMGFQPHHSIDEIGAIVGRGKATIQRWFDKYRAAGLGAVLTRAYKGGIKSRCDKEVEAFLLNGLKVARWNTAVQAGQELERHFGRSFAYKTVWRWLKKCAGVLRVPRPVHEKRDSAKAEAFKRDFFKILQELSLTRGNRVRVWFADESRFGLLPVYRRCWTQRGLRPHKKYQTRYQWSYCYGALDVVNGEMVCIQTPSTNLQWTEAFLQQIKKQYPEEEHVVVWDGAGFHPHDSEHPNVPPGIHIVNLPPYSPELNPIERLWDMIQDQTANKLWPSIKRLEEVVATHLKDWWEDTEKVLSLVGGGWQHIQANASAK